MTTDTPSLSGLTLPTRSEDKARNDRALRLAREGLARGLDADTGYQAAPIYRDALQEVIRTLAGDA